MPQSLRRSRRHNRVVRNSSRRLLVESLESRQLLATFPVINLLGDNSAGSLGAAIASANALGGSNSINFEVTGTITLTDPLPQITSALTIDATTLAGYAGTPLIQIVGTGGLGDGLVISAPGAKIAGLAISGFSAGAGILINSSTNTATNFDTVTSCFLGTDATGSTAVANIDGLDIVGSSYNVIGATTYTAGGQKHAAYNVFSGNTDNGVSIEPSATGTDATNNVIGGSNIGVDAAGTAALANGLNGVQIDSVTGNTIGGLVPAGIDTVRNVISGNVNNGINFANTSNTTTDNVVEDNLIGLNAAGTAAIANGTSSGGSGVGFLGNTISGNTIGGTSAAARNVISGNFNDGVSFNGVSGNVLEGNYIGTDALGDTIVKNGGYGVDIFDTSSGDTIGGTVAGAGNVISGNGLAGVDLFASGSTNDTGSLIAGNFIGLNAAGTQALGNSDGGITSTASGITIGGVIPSAANVISGNVAPQGGGGSSGVIFNNGSGNLVEGNYIGTDLTGEVAIPNRGDGVYIDGGGRDTIGGTTFATRNVISGNFNDGIHVDSSTGSNLIEGNYIGIDEDDTATEGDTLGNGGDGIYLAGTTGDTIGGSTAAAGNVIGGNSGDGIAINSPVTATKDVIEGNDIGTDSSNDDFGNLDDGVHLDSAKNIVGQNASTAAGVTTYTGLGNTIAYNTGAGVLVIPNLNQNTILSNSIYDNSDLGINLGGGAVPTTNFPNEQGAVPGPNDNQNYPVLASAITDGISTTVVSGSLNANANTSYVIQFFASPTEDPSLYGQGEVLVGSTTVKTDATGNVSFTNLALSTGTNVAAGDYISATATNQGSNPNTVGDTSEFSADVMAQGTADVSVTGTVSPSGTVFVGQSIVYTFIVTNNGPDDARSVNFTDTLPTGATYITSSTTQGTITLSGDELSVDVGDLPPPATGSTANTTTITITVVPTVPASSSNPLTDTATVATIDDDTDLTNNTYTITTDVDAVVPVALSITSSPNPVLVGEDLTYTIAVANESNSPATNVDVTDDLDPNETFVSASLTPSTAGTVSETSPSEIDADIATLAGNQTVYITVTVMPTAGAATAGSVTESATVNYDQIDSDSNTAEHSATVTTDVVPAVNLSVTFSPAPTPNPVAVGQDLTYTVVVANSGPSTATNVQFTDDLDPNVTFLSGTWNTSPAVSLNEAAGVLTQNIGSLAAGASTSFTIVVQPSAGVISSITDTGTVSNTASVTEDETDLTPANTTATVTNNVVPLVALTFGTPLVNGVATNASGTSGSYTSSAVYAGEQFSYTFSVTNNGPSTANNVIIADDLPAGLTYVSATSSQGGEPLQSDGIVTANLGVLAPNATGSVTINVTATGAAAQAGSVVNSATVSANENESAAPVSPIVTTPVNPATSLAVTVVGAPNPIVVNQPLTYTVKVTNNGPSSASDVSLNDTLDPSVTFVSASTSLGTSTSAGTLSPPSGGVLAVNLGTLAVGATATLTVVVTPTAAGTVTNLVNVTNTPEVVTDAPVSNTTTTTIEPSVNLEVALTGNPSTVTIGNNLDYNATVENGGPSTATNVVVTDILPAGVTLISAIGSAGESVTQTGNVVTGQVSELANGASASLSIVVAPTTTGSISDELSATASETDTNANNSQTSVTNTVVEPPGTLQFSAAVFTADDDGGPATITVSRSNGDQGTVTVHYATTSGSAAPGVNFIPVSGTLTFPQGATSESFTVPVIDDVYSKQDTVVGVEIDTPSGGAVLGAQSSTTLDIHVTNPDVTSPTVTNVSWFGPGATITGIVVTFSKDVNVAAATNVNNYHVVDTGKGGVYGDANNVPVTLTGAYYDAATDTVTLTTATPLKSNEFYHLDINGSKPGAIADDADNLLAGNGAAGTDYQSYFARGTKLFYVDASGSSVTLRLAGGGVLDVSRYADGEGDVLNVVDPRLHRTTLSGSVKGGTTSFNSMTGLGSFGDVRVLLRTPPFTVTNFPYVGTTALSIEAVDQALGSADLNAKVAAKVTVKPKVAAHRR